MVRETGGVRSRGFIFDDHWFGLTRGVFDPVRHLSGLAFADVLADVVAECGPGARTALDLGTGCGLLGATLARLGLKVVATDISEAAARCAAQNCLELDVDVRHGDMFAPVEGETFDLVVVNPPYERKNPSWLSSSALTSPDFLEKLGARVHQFAPTLVLGFPIDDAAVLGATCLDLVPWRTVATSGHDLGIFVSSTPTPQT
ncbi:MAG: hypothetical protein ACI9BK_001946 [Acidimicrobiales bacterium]|jgi:hypothetical protein